MPVVLGMRLLPALLLVSAFALAGCADDSASDDDADSGTGTGMPSGGMGNMTAPMDAAPMERTVMMQNNQFSPVALTIHVGDTVTWHTMDLARHNVVSDSPGNEYRSGDVSSANVGGVMPDHVSHTFSTVGHVDYVCEYHPGMEATLDVVPANQTIPDDA